MKKETPRRLAIRLFLTLCINTIVAILVWTHGNYSSFGRVLIVSHCIGYSCMLAALSMRHYFSKLSVFNSIFAAIIGLTLGVSLAFMFGIPLEGNSLSTSLAGTWRYLLLGLAIILAFRFDHLRQAQLMTLEADQAAARLREAQGRKALAEAQLRALQAQIEPHFLFNTLANLHSLIGRDDMAARNLLEQIIDYLRATLAHSRAAHATLRDECDMLSTYLSIQTLRMGGRFSWDIDIPDDLLALPFPPMLLQPLVENAIRHGLEPKLGQGHLHLSGRQTGESLQLCVADDGIGLASHAPSGTGITNIRERLLALFGEQARLDIKEHTPTGTLAELWIPFSPAL
jgi:LytS/YehU family sensor histidine kinase